MRIVSSLHEIGFSEESISRSPTPWFAGGRALPGVPVAVDARMASEGMSFQLSCQLEVQNIRGLLIQVPCRFSGPCLPESGSRQRSEPGLRQNHLSALRAPGHYWHQGTPRPPQAALAGESATQEKRAGCARPRIPSTLHKP